MFPLAAITAALLTVVLLIAPQPLLLRDHLRLQGTQLDLRGTDADDQDLAALAKEEFRSVTSVLLASTRVGDQGLKHLRHLAVSQLDLGRTRVTSAGLTHLAGLPIERLELTGTAVDDRGLAHLRSLPLRILVLRNTKVADGFAALAGSKLTLLDLAHTATRDESLADLTKVTRLETLLLSETGVTDRALPHIARIRGLQSVDLAGTAVTETALAAFRREHPAIEVNTERPVR